MLVLSQWQDVKLGDVLTLKRGYDLPHRERRAGDVPIISSSGITDFHDTAKVKGPGVVTGRYGTLGEIFFVENDYWPLNTSLYVQNFKGNHPRFISYFLRTLNFATQNVAGAVPGVNRNFLHMMPVKLPPLETQRQIAAVLSAYDDLIENNRGRIKVLEEMAGLVYREWFVNFRFPGHEGVRRVASELGEIPKGWGVVSVSEAVALDPTVKVPKNEPKDFVPMSGLNPDSMLITDFEVRTGNSGAKFQNGDTLFARITPSCEHGKTGFVQFLPSDESVAVGSTEFIVMRSRNLNPYFVYFLARLPDLRQHAINSMSGASGRQRVQKQCFDTLEFAHPTQDILTKFAEIAEPIFRSIHTLNAKTQNLRRTRDLLLPKLISGELDVTQLGEAHPETAQVA